MSQYLFQVRIHRVPNPVAILVSEDEGYINSSCNFISNSTNETDFTEEEAKLIFKNYTKTQYSKGELITLTATKNNIIKTVCSYAERN